MIESLAGEEGNPFFGINSELGPGFFVLIAYSVFAGFFQYLFNCAVCKYFQIDVYGDKVNYVWTSAFRCFLTQDDDTLENSLPEVACHDTSKSCQEV